MPKDAVDELIETLHKIGGYHEHYNLVKQFETTAHNKGVEVGREEEANRIQKYLYEKSHAGFDQNGEEYERIVHWCYVKEALTPLQEVTIKWVMKETLTLLERCQREARKNYQERSGVNENGNFCTFDNLAEIIANTLKQAAEEILRIAPGFENTKTGEVTYDVGVQEYMARIEALSHNIDLSAKK